MIIASRAWPWALAGKVYRAIRATETAEGGVSGCHPTPPSPAAGVCRQRGQRRNCRPSVDEASEATPDRSARHEMKGRKRAQTSLTHMLTGHRCPNAMGSITSAWERRTKGEVRTEPPERDVLCHESECTSIHRIDATPAQIVIDKPTLKYGEQRQIDYKTRAQPARTHKSSRSVVKKGVAWAEWQHAHLSAESRSQSDWKRVGRSPNSGRAKRPQPIAPVPTTASAGPSALASPNVAAAGPTSSMYVSSSGEAGRVTRYGR
eukprot:2383076-Prymnesium_polylepis.1